MDMNNTKAESELYWGDFAKLPQIDAIFRACEDLDAAQKPINRETVRLRSGVTFNNLLAAGIKLYRKRQEQTQSFVHTPNVLLHLIGQALDKTFETLHKGFDNQVKEIEGRYIEILNSTSLDMDALQHEIDKQKNQLLEKEAGLNLLIEEKAELIEQLDIANQHYKTLETKYNTLLSEHRELNQQLSEEKNRRQEQGSDHRLAIDTLTEKHNKHIQALTEQQDKAYDRVMTQLGNEREQWKVERKRLDKMLTEYKNELVNKQSTVEGYAGQVIALNNQLQSKQGLENKLEIEIETNRLLTAKLESLQTVEQNNAVLQTELAQLKSELSAKTSLVEQLPGFEQFDVIQRQLDALQVQMNKNKVGET